MSWATWVRCLSQSGLKDLVKSALKVLHGVWKGANLPPHVNGVKVLLIQPPIRDFYQTPIRTQPIGLAYLASSLRAQGVEVEILDCQTQQRRSIPVPPELSYLQDFYPFNDQSPFKLYTGYYHFGMEWDEIRRRIEESKADLFGISSSFTPYHEEALQVARLIKEWDSRKIVVMGGSHVSGEPEVVLKSPWVDYVILGEGEERFSLLVEKIGKARLKEIRRIDGIGFLVDGHLYLHPLKTFIKDLDGLPHPARDLLHLDRYRIHRKRSTMIITSRGCPHGCAYCSAHLVMGATFRIRSPENILQEMLECHQRYGIEVFDVEDDNLTYDLGRAKRWLELLMGAFGERRIELTAMNGLSFAALDGEMLSLMKRAGFHTLNLSYVSSDPSTQERMRRPRGREDFDHLLKKALEVGLRIIAYAIMGMPGQTLEEMVTTLVDLMNKRVLIGPSIYYPVPGTPLFDTCKEGGYLPSNRSQWRSSTFPIETGHFSRLDMVSLLRLVRVINFIKRKMDSGELEEGITWRELFTGLASQMKDEAGGEKGMTSWAHLLFMMFRERAFFSLRKIAPQKYSLQREATSRRVLDSFFEKAWEKPILKSRKD